MKRFYYILCLLLIFSQSTFAGNLKLDNSETKIAVSISATISGGTSVCQNAPQPVITFTGLGGTAPYTFTYKINTAAETTVATTGTNASVTVPVATTATGTFTYTLISVKDATSAFISVTGNEVINVIDNFTVNAGADIIVCKGNTINLSATLSAGSPSGVSYSWSGPNNYSGSTATISRNNAITAMSGNYTITAKIGDCEKQDVVKVTVLEPELSSSQLQDYEGTKWLVRCTTPGVATGNIFISNGLSSDLQSLVTGYTIDWGDSTTPFSSNGANWSTNLSHTYSVGLHSLSITITTTIGCTINRIYKVFVGNQPASPQIQLPENAQGCVPFQLNFPISGVANNIPGTTYTITFSDDPTHPLHFDQSTIPPSIQKTFNTPSCNSTFTNGSNVENNAYGVSIRAINPCGSASSSAGPIRTSIPPTPIINAVAKGCVNQTISFNDASTNGSIVTATSCNTDSGRYWQITPATGWTVVGSTLGSNGGFPDEFEGWNNGSQSIGVKFQTAGTYTIKLFKRNGCSVTKDTEKTICIDSIAVPDFTLNNNTGCAPLALQATNITNTASFCDSPIYKWEVSFTSASCGTNSSPSYTFANGTSDISQNASFNFVNAGIYTIKLKVTNSCGTEEITKQVTVRKPPAVSITNIPNACGTTSVTITPTVNITNCVTQAPAYLWTAPNGTITNATTASPTISYNAPGTYTVTVAVTNECGTNTVSQTVTVANAPTVNPVTNIEKCKGQSIPATTFGSSETGVTFQWTNSNTAIGLAASGTGHLPSFTANNTTTAPIVATISVTAIKGSCTGPTQTFTITIQPEVIISPVTDITICNGATHPGTTFNSNVGTATYTWTNNQPSIGLLATGPTAIPSFMAINTGTSPIVATITVTPTINGCAGTSKTFTITVNPTPQALTLTNKILCHSEPSGVITFSNPVSGTNYTWTNSNPAIGLAASGTGNISFNATNTSTAPIIATITVTGTASGCVAPAQTFTITVNPSPVVTFSEANQSICTGSASTEVTLQSATTGVDFSWTAVTPSGITGMTNSGTTTIPAQNLVNTTNAPITITYKAKAALTGTTPCPGVEFPYTITVLPKAANISGLPTTICSGATFTITPVNGSGNIVPAGTTYTWLTAPDITPPGSVTGAFAQTTPQTSISQTLTNTTNAVATVKYTVIPVSNGCIGDSFEVIVNVNPVPVVDATTNITKCSGETIPQINFSGNVTGAAYDWSASAGTIGMAASTGSNIIPGFTAQNTGAAPIILTITVTPKFDICNGTPKTFTITINPAPEVLFSMNEQSLCSGGTAQQVSMTSPTANTTFAWTATAPVGSGLTQTSGSGSTLPTETFTNTTGAPIEVIYTVTASTTGIACQGVSKTHKITVHPLPTISTQPIAQQEVCVGGTLSALTVDYAGGHGTPAYQWYSNTSASNVGGNIIGGATASSYTPPTTAAGTVYYYAIVTLSGNGCGTATSDYATIKIVPDPVITSAAFAPQTLCAGATAQALTVTASGGSDSPNYIYQWYISNNNSTTGGTAITGETASTFTAPVPAQVTTAETKYYYCEVKTAVSGCSVFSSVAEVKVIPAPVFTTQPQSANVCHNQTPAPLTVAYINGAGTATYQWYSNTSASTLGAQPVGTNTPTYQPSGATVGITYYYATVTFSSGGCSIITSAFAEVKINPLTEVTSTETATICSGQQFTVSPVHGSGNNVPPGTTYTWAMPGGTGYTGGSAQATPQSNISQTLINTTTSPVTATYAVTPAYNGCAGNPFTVTVTVNPKATIANAVATICSGGTFTIDPITIVGASIPVNTTYSWSAPIVTGGLTGGTAGTAQTVITGTLSNPTTATQIATYTVTPLSQPGSCAGDSFTIVVTVKPQLAVTSVLSDYTGFEISTAGGSDGSIDLTVTGGSGIYNYAWTGPNGFTATTQDLTGLTVGVYTVTVTDGLCNAVIIPFNIREPLPLVIQEVVVSHVNVNCFGQSTGIVEVEITQPSIAPFDYQIILQGGGIVETVNNLTALNYVFDNLAAGTYDIKVTDANGTVKTIIGVVITQPASGLAISNAAVSSHNGFSITCNGANNGSIDLTVTGGYPAYTYTWTGPNGFIASTQDISNLSPGNYNVVIGDSTNVCTITQSYTITEPQPVTFTGIKSDYNGFGVSCSGGSNGAITITPAGGTGMYIYQWTGPTGFTASAQNLTGLFAGTYTVTVSDSNGCTAAQETYTLTEPLSMAITETHTNLLCFGASTGSVTVNVTGGVPGTSGYGYAWAGPNGFTATTQNLANVMAGAYTLTVTDASGCSATITATLTQPTEITIIPTQTPISCYGANDASLSLAISGGVGTYQVTWDNFASGTYQDNLAAGTYVITVTDSNNCVKVISVVIPEAPIFTINPVHTNISCHGANDGSIVLNLVGGQAPVSLVWNDDPTAGNARFNLPAGTYTVTITDSKPCVITRSFIIVEPQPLTLGAVVTNADHCTNTMSGAINLLPAGGSPPFTYSWSNGAATEDLVNITSGNYSVTVTDSRGCSVARQFQVNRPLPLEVTVSSNVDFNCATKYVMQTNTATASGGVPPYLYSWSSGTVSGQGGRTMTTNQNGSITVTVTDLKGCTATHTFEVDTQQLGDISHTITSYGFETYGLYSIIDPIQFTNTSTGDFISVSWDFGDGAVSDQESPAHSYQRGGTYIVTQTVVYPYGCISRKTITLIVEKGYNVMIPDGFTPNADGINDTFNAQHTGLKSIQLDVYDTWGSMIYSEKGETLRGWDGNVKGVPAENGNFYYRMKAETFYGNIVNYEGPLVLIK